MKFNYIFAVMGLLFCLINHGSIGNCESNDTSVDSIDSIDSNDTSSADSSDSSDGNYTSIADCDDIDWDVEFVGKSGQFKLFPCVDSNTFIKVKIDSIQGVNSDGTLQSSNKRSSFAYASAESASNIVSESSIYNVYGVNGSNITLTGVSLYYEFNVPNGAQGTLVTFMMNVYLIEETTFIEYPDSSSDDEDATVTVMLEEGAIKFDYVIEDWPFENDDDNLRITLLLTVGGTDAEVSSSGSDGTSVLSIGSDDNAFTLTSPEVYENIDSDGNSTSGDVEVTVGNNATVDGEAGVYISFEFIEAGNAQTIIYDPTVQGDNGDTSDSGSTPSNTDDNGSTMDSTSYNSTGDGDNTNDDNQDSANVINSRIVFIYMAICVTLGALFL